jgi:hypothetical protein
MYKERTNMPGQTRCGYTKQLLALEFSRRLLYPSNFTTVFQMTGKALRSLISPIFLSHWVPGGMNLQKAYELTEPGRVESLHTVPGVSIAVLSPGVPLIRPDSPNRIRDRDMHRNNRKENTPPWAFQRECLALCPSNGLCLVCVRRS